MTRKIVPIWTQMDPELSTPDPDPDQPFVRNFVETVPLKK
jgi:hypothetical protein